MENTDTTMDKEVYIAAKKGNVKFLEETQINEYLLRKTHKKNNIIHVAIRNQQLEFITAILRRFPNNREIVSDENSEKNTPLHIAAEVGNKEIGSVIYGHLKDLIVKGAENPLRSKNLQGNTAAHHALVHGNVDIAMFFLDKDPGLVRVVNYSLETLLHLAVKHFVDKVESESIKARIKYGEAYWTIDHDLRKGVGNNMSTKIVSTLVMKAGYVTCWHDKNGLTPLHRAASIDAPFNLDLIRSMIEEWPQSAEECDNSGKSILHLLINRTPNYKACKNLLEIQDIFNLRNSQDDQGNTPLHIATLKMDTIMTRVLVEFETNLYICNMEGISSTSLIHQQNLIKMLEKGTMTKEESEAADKADTKYLKESLKTSGISLLRSTDSNGGNILHKLFKSYGANCKSVSSLCNLLDEEFIGQVLCENPTMVNQQDINWDTPIHVIARDAPFIELLDICVKVVGASYNLPWLLPNKDGNNPLLLALLYANRDPATSFYKMVIRLIDCDPNAVGQSNFHQENALHLIKHSKNIAKHMKKSCPWWPYYHTKDINGCTPLMRALEGGWEFTAIELLSEQEELLLDGGGGENNTVMHVAVKNKRFDFINHLFDIYEPSVPLSTGRPVLTQLFIGRVNNDNATPADLLGELDTVPLKLAARLWRHRDLRGIRSTWGIPKSQLQTYMSSMNVIAALLTTITFTAAFTVPGGLNEEKGIPLLMSSITFQVFMISDVIAMCLSMMVLFCLLWIVATGKRNAVMIQDFSLSLLLASFVATLVTFMMGVFATIFPDNRWIPITTLVLCCMLMLLVRRYILTKFFLPLKNVIMHPIHIVTIKCFSFVTECIRTLYYKCIDSCIAFSCLPYVKWVLNPIASLWLRWRNSSCRRRLKVFFFF